MLLWYRCVLVQIGNKNRNANALFDLHSGLMQWDNGNNGNQPTTTPSPSPTTTPYPQQTQPTREGHSGHATVTTNSTTSVNPNKGDKQSPIVPDASQSSSKSSTNALKGILKEYTDDEHNCSGAQTENLSRKIVLFLERCERNDLDKAQEPRVFSIML